MRTLPVFTLAVLVTMLFGVPAWSQPRAPYVEKNRCPFECCQFGTWIARTALNAYADEGDTTKVAFSVSMNDTIVAESGNLHFERLGRILVTKPIYGFLPGDTLIATECSGEEGYEVWQNGKPLSVEIFWKTPYTPDEDEFESEEAEDTARFSGVMLSRPEMIWWVRIRNIRGEIGWLRLVNRTVYCFLIEERIDGMDGCG